MNRLQDAVMDIASQCLLIVEAKTYDEAMKHFDDVVHGVQLVMEMDFRDYFKFNEDAAQRLAFGLCKKYGIELPKGATPAQAWEALKKKTGKEARDFYNESGKAGSPKIRFNTANVKSFTKSLRGAKMSQKDADRWRVTGMERSELRDWHPDAKLHVTDGGSTVAVDNGDIVGVCKNANDKLHGSDLISFAVKNGGNKLDSYEGNHGFYVKCGFEPVSWCEWDSAYEDDAQKQGWNPQKHDREAIIFYRYVGVGKVKNEDASSFKKRVKPSPDYDSAMSKRDAVIGGGTDG